MNSAIIVKDVEITEVQNQPEVRLVTEEISRNEFIDENDPLFLTPDSITQENIRIHHFRTFNGKNLYIGWSKKVEDTIGIPLRVIDGMNTTIIKQEEKIGALSAQINSLWNMSFLDRIKFVFLARFKEIE
jgi:hypothetical protein